MVDTLAQVKTPEAKDEVRALLEKRSRSEIEALCIEALRRWYRERRENPDNLRQFQMHAGLGRSLVRILLESEQAPAAEARVNALGEPFLSHQSEPWMQFVVESMWQLVRAGYLIPISPSPTSNGWPISYYVTERGHKLLASNNEHPFLPGFLERLATRCPALPDSVLVLLEDARTCLEHGLLRPSLILVGVACETAIDSALNSLVDDDRLPSKILDKKAAQRIVQLKKELPNLISDREGYNSALAAYDFADHLRQRRNDGSHPIPTYPFDDAAEIEEIILSASRHLPALMSVANPAS